MWTNRKVHKRNSAPTAKQNMAKVRSKHHMQSLRNKRTTGHKSITSRAQITSPVSAYLHQKVITPPPKPPVCPIISIEKESSKKVAHRSRKMDPSSCTSLQNVPETITASMVANKERICVLKQRTPAAFQPQPDKRSCVTHTKCHHPVCVPQSPIYQKHI